MAGILSLFGDNSGAYDDYANQLKDISKKYDPLIAMGDKARNRIYDEYGQLIDNPNALQDEIAGGYENSAYQNHLLDQVSKRSNINAANTGMIMSPLAQKALNENINTMTGQFMNDYIDRSIGTYGMGMQGLSGISNAGAQGLNNQVGMLDDAAGANLQGDISENSAWNNLFGTTIGAAGMAFGVPPVGFASGMFGGGSGGSAQMPKAVKGNDGFWNDLPDF